MGATNSSNLEYKDFPPKFWWIILALLYLFKKVYPKEVIQSNSKIKCDSVSVYTEQKVSVDIRVTMINIELKNIQLYKCHPLL